MLKEYRNIHRGDVCIVAGMGPSLPDIQDFYDDDIKIIGCNDANRICALDYQVIAENIMKPRGYDHPLTAQKVNAIIETDCPIIFTRHDIPFKTAKVCEIEINSLEMDSIGAMFRKGILFGTKKIGMVGIALAMYMGFSVIGVIGHDLKGRRYIEDAPFDTLRIQRHHVDNENRYAAIVNRYAEKKRTYICNLSTVSLITAFPRLTPREFRQKVLKHGNGKQV
jgi:hypothetical protein